MATMLAHRSAQWCLAAPGNLSHPAPCMRQWPAAGSQLAAAFPARRRQQQRLAVHVAASGGFGKPVEKKLSKQKACPCGSGLAFKECCQRYHDGELPGTPEALMRSRYSAYVKDNWRYVLDTTHPDNPLANDPQSLKDDIQATCDSLGFEKLKILSVEGGKDEDEGYVTFQAWFKNQKQMGQRAQGWHTQTFVERSRFLREGGRWLYVDGEQDWQR